MTTTTIPHEIIFVDESGNPGLNAASRLRSPFFSFGFVYCVNPTNLRHQLKRLLRREHKRNRWPRHVQELKFFLPVQDMLNKWGYSSQQIRRYQSQLQKVRIRALSVLLQNSCYVFGSILEKNKIKSTTWTPTTIGNYVFASSLFSNVLRNINPAFPPTVIFDAGRLSVGRGTLAFQNYLMKKEVYYNYHRLSQNIKTIAVPVQASSQLEPGLWAADLVAGAFRVKYHLNDPSYANLLKSIYISNGERYYW